MTLMYVIYDVSVSFFLPHPVQSAFLIPFPISTIGPAIDHTQILDHKDTYFDMHMLFEKKILAVPLINLPINNVYTRSACPDHCLHSHPAIGI